MRKIFYFSFALYAIYNILNTSSVYAENACVKIYGGGQGFCLPNPTPPPMRVFPTSTLPQTTKGGLPILSPSQVATNPATGPEALSLLVLGGAATLGSIIHKISKKA